MKHIYISYGAAAFLALLTSCNADDELLQAYDENHIICIEKVSQQGFEASQPARAAYNGFATSFADNDKLGLLLIGENGKQMNHVSCTYTAGEWKTDGTQYYSSAIKKIIAYFPYNSGLSEDIDTLDELKGTVNITTDQSTEDKLKAMDLLVAEIETPKAALQINFTHAFSLIALSAESNIQVGDENFSYNVDMENVSLSIGDALYTTCVMNGTNVCLIKDNTSLKNGEFRYFYTIGEETSVKTVKTELTVASGTRYTFPCPASASTSEGIAAGDFYCTTSTGKTVVLPGNAASIPEQLTCHGVIFHIMDENAFGDYASANGLTSNEYSGYQGKHGLVVSAIHGGKFGQMNAESVKQAFTSIPNCGDTDVLNGYKLTQAIKEAAQNQAPEFFTALTGHEAPIAGATPWYLGSFGEIRFLIQGANRENGSTAGQEQINKQLSKIQGGAQLEGNIPSVSFKADQNGFCIMQNGSEMGWHGIPDGEMYRPICAF